MVVKVADLPDSVDDLAPGGAGALDAPTFDTAHFRSVMGHFCTGVTIVAGVSDGVALGLTCQSLVSLSLDPPLVAFSPSRMSTSWPRIEQSGAFSVNVLTEDQEDLSRVFATPGADKFRGVAWRPGETGSPILGDVLAWVDCRIVGRHEAGDHLIIIGHVLELNAANRGRPLLAYRGGYGRFEA